MNFCGDTGHTCELCNGDIIKTFDPFLHGDEKRINIDASPSLVKRLHPTLKKCACGFVGSKHLFTKHMDVMLMSARSGGEDAKVFWQKHGEVLLHEDEV